MSGIDAPTRPVREGLYRDGKLIAGRSCSSGRIHFPKPDLGAVGGEDVSEVALGGSCTLFSFTIVHMKTAHFDPPYAIGYVDFPEGVRVFGPIQTDDLASLKVGMPLSVRIGPLWHAADGTAIVAHCFVPIVGN